MSHYQTLGVPKDAPPERIKKSYRTLARKYHPDRSEEPNAEAEFKRIQHAYDVVGDPERRAYYDETGKDDKEDEMEGARGLLAYTMKQVLIATIDSPHLNLVSAIHTHLSKLQDELNEQVEQHRAVLTKMEKHKGRVKTEEGSLNMYEEIVQSEYRRAKAMIADHPVMIERIRNARVLLKGYSCAELAPPEQSWRPLWG
jgi:curved DNA-binding protein CbpA